MKLLNLGCGGTRPESKHWINVDDLHAQFPNEGCPERLQMDAEENYVNHNLQEPLPFESNSVNGILMSHLLEHLTPQEAVRLLRESRRVLLPGGILRIATPDPVKFFELSKQGCKDWGEPCYEPKMTFMEYALFFAGHKQLIGMDALNCMFFLAGFDIYQEKAYKQSACPGLADLDNRPKFTLFVEAIK